MVNRSTSLVWRPNLRRVFSAYGGKGRLFLAIQLYAFVFVVVKWNSAPVGLAAAILGAVAAAMSEHTDKQWWQRIVWFGLLGGLLMVERNAIVNDRIDTRKKADEAAADQARQLKKQAHEVLNRIDDKVDVNIVEFLPRSLPEVNAYVGSDKEMGLVEWPRLKDDPMSHFAMQLITIAFDSPKDETLLSLKGQCVSEGTIRFGLYTVEDGPLSSMLASPSDLVLYCRIKGPWARRAADVLSYDNLEGSNVSVNVLQDGKNPMPIDLREIHIEGKQQSFTVQTKPLPCRPGKRGVCFGAPLIFPKNVFD